MSFAIGDSAGASRQKELSVVLPFYNALQCLDITVQSLQKQTLDPAVWEIVVVDDGSGLPVGPLLEGVDGHVAIRLVTAGRNLGRSGARNLGVSKAEGATILFHDPDAFIAPDAVQRHYDFHRRSPGSVLMGARYDFDMADPEPAAGRRLLADREETRAGSRPARRGRSA